MFHCTRILSYYIFEKWLPAIKFAWSVYYYCHYLDVDTSNLKSIWDLLLSKEILERNNPKDTIEEKNSEEYLSLVKRAQTSLTPYESVGE